ncbi:hypothetical protein [Nocardia thailandica]
MLKEPGVEDTARSFSGATGSNRVDHPVTPTDFFTRASALTPHPGHDDREHAERLWRALAPRLAGRQWMRLFVADTGHYDDSSRLSWKRLPDRPAAVMTHSASGRAHTLFFDLDPTRSLPHAEAVAAVRRDFITLISWLEASGAVWFADTSPRGGIHVYVPLHASEPMSPSAIKPLYRELHEALPSLDPLPMVGHEQGCITVPGSPCRGGGYRMLLGSSLDQALAVLARRSEAGVVARLRGMATPALFLSSRFAIADPEASDPDQSAPLRSAASPTLVDDDYTVTPTRSRRALPAWVADYTALGVVPARFPSPSEARLSVLAHHASRGWSLNDIRATARSADWASFWTAYTQRNDGPKRLADDWAKAMTHAREMAQAQITGKSSRSAHKPEQTHTGGMGAFRPIRWKLAAARKWILTSGEFSGAQVFSALAVVTALAYAISLEGKPSAAVGGRWLAVAAGVLGDDTTRAVLKKLLRIDGSPVRLIEPWSARTHNGDRLALVDPRLDGKDVRAAEWEAIAARPEPIDPTWGELGLSAWWIHTVLNAIEPAAGAPVAPKILAAAARVSLSTVHRAIEKLVDGELADAGHGWVSRTHRTPRQVPLISAAADDRRADRIARHQRERAEFWQFWDLVVRNWSRREIVGYADLADLAADDSEYWDALAPGAAPSRTPPPRDPPTDEDAAAIALLQSAFGAELVCPAESQARVENSAHTASAIP